MSKDVAEFVIYIINETANIRGKSTSQVYKILEETGCIKNYLVPLYDILHTMGSEGVVDDVIEYVEARGENVMMVYHGSDVVCECRNGGIGYKRYDIIKGKVANDKVFRVVDMYKRGIWDKQRAIQEIRAYENYDQIAFISQSAIDSILVFRDSFEVKA